MSQHYQPGEAPADGHIVVGQVEYDNGIIASVWRTPGGGLYEEPEPAQHQVEAVEADTSSYALQEHERQGPAQPQEPYRGFVAELGAELRQIPWWGWALYTGALGLAGLYAYWGATTQWGFWGTWGYWGFALIFAAGIAVPPLGVLEGAIPKRYGYVLVAGAVLALLGAAGWFVWWSWVGFSAWWGDATWWGKAGFIVTVVVLAVMLALTIAPDLGVWVIPVLLLLVVPPLALLGLIVVAAWSGIGRTLSGGNN